MSQFKIIWRKFWKLVTTFPMTEELELARLCARREVSLPRQRHYFCHSSSASEKCSCRNVQWWDLFPAGKQPVKSDYGLPHLMFFFYRFLIYQHKKSTLWFCYGSQSCPQIFSHNFLWMFSIELPTTEHYIQWGKIQTSYEIFILESWWTFAYYTINTALTLKPY